jgi:hypothetical protein
MLAGTMARSCAGWTGFYGYYYFSHRLLAGPTP